MCICLISFFAHWFSPFFLIRVIISRCGSVFGFTVIYCETAYKLCIGQDVKESPNACLLGYMG